MRKLILIFIGIILIVIGYYEMNQKETKIIVKEDPDIHFKNAGVGSSEEILKQRTLWEKQYESKPGEIFDNLFQGKIIGLLSA